MSLRRHQPGEVSPMGEAFLACCYSLMGLSAAGLIVLRWLFRRIDEASALPAGRSS